MIQTTRINTALTDLFATRGKGEELGINRKSWYQYKQLFKQGKLSRGKQLEILDAAGLLSLRVPQEAKQPTGGVKSVLMVDYNEMQKSWQDYEREFK